MILPTIPWGAGVGRRKFGAKLASCAAKIKRCGPLPDAAFQTAQTVTWVPTSTTRPLGI
jgi:hypothetical protein